MLGQILTGAALIIATTFIHAAFTMAALVIVRLAGTKTKILYSSWVTRIGLIGLLVLTMVIASVIEVLVWAVTFLATGAITGLEQALYFSAVTFTTLGYGDVVLGEDWRMLGALAAMNGIIIFGWTTALIVAFLSHLFAAHARLGGDRS
jgi:hypothetical protein